MVRTTLPKVLPPTLKGDVVKAVRYFYYITAAIRWSRCAQENGHSSPPHATASLERLVSISSFLIGWFFYVPIHLKGPIPIRTVLSFTVFELGIRWFLKLSRLLAVGFS